MKRKIKIVLALLGIAALSLILFIAVGLYAMEIEDHYGDYQDFYYKSRSGDVIVNRDLMEFVRIEKTWTRIYGIHNSDTMHLWSWLSKNRVEVYRPKHDLDFDALTYAKMKDLINKGDLKLIISK